MISHILTTQHHGGTSTVVPGAGHGRPVSPHNSVQTKVHNPGLRIHNERVGNDDVQGILQMLSQNAGCQGLGNMRKRVLHEQYIDVQHS